MQSVLWRVGLSLVLTVGAYGMLGYWAPLSDGWSGGLAVAGGLVWLGGMCLYGARGAHRIRGLILAAQRGDPLLDGELVAVSGQIHPIAGREPLHSALFGRQCVIYSYDLDKYSRVKGESYPKANGSAMVPSEIRHAQGSMRIYGFPQLDGFPHLKETDRSFWPTAQSYIAALPASAHEEPGGIGEAFRRVREIFEDEDGEVKEDTTGFPPGTPNLDSYRLDEQIVPVGLQVTACGRYVLAKNGLVGDLEGKLGKPRSAIMLEPGDLTRAARRRVVRFAVALVLGLMLVLGVNAVCIAIVIGR